MVDLVPEDSKSYYNYIAYAQEARGNVKYVKKRQDKILKIKFDLLDVRTMVSEIKDTLGATTAD